MELPMSPSFLLLLSLPLPVIPSSSPLSSLPLHLSLLRTTLGFLHTSLKQMSWLSHVVIRRWQTHRKHQKPLKEAENTAIHPSGSHSRRHLWYCLARLYRWNELTNCSRWIFSQFIQIELFINVLSISTFSWFIYKIMTHANAFVLALPICILNSPLETSPSLSVMLFWVVLFVWLFSSIFMLHWSIF